MCGEIFDRPPHSIGVFLKSSKSVVAGRAQEAPNVLAVVAVINMSLGPGREFSLTDHTAAFLLGPEFVIIFPRESIRGQHTIKIPIFPYIVTFSVRRDLFFLSWELAPLPCDRSQFRPVLVSVLCLPRPHLRSMLLSILGVVGPVRFGIFVGHS